MTHNVARGPLPWAYLCAIVDKVSVVSASHGRRGTMISGILSCSIVRVAIRNRNGILLSMLTALSIHVRLADTTIFLRKQAGALVQYNQYRPSKNHNLSLITYNLTHFAHWINNNCSGVIVGVPLRLRWTPPHNFWPRSSGNCEASYPRVSVPKVLRTLLYACPSTGWPSYFNASSSPVDV